MKHSLRSVCALVSVLWFALVGTAHAHDPGLSAAELRIHADEVTAHLTFAWRELETLTVIDGNRDGSVSEVELAAVAPRLQIWAMDALEIRMDGERLAARHVTIYLDPSDALRIELRYEPRRGSSLGVSAPILSQLARGHRQYVSLRDRSGAVVAHGMLDASHPSLNWPLTPTMARNMSPSFLQFLILGVEHILTGYDHLLFLFGLLVVGGSFRSAVGIISAFTVAHSLTLALATFDLVRLPPQVVEPLIASSILYVGLENLFRRGMDHRWLLTFGFGLVHGLGFASVLRDLGIGVGSGGNVVWPLLAFNLGVELGQIAIAVFVLQLIWKSRKLPRFAPRFVTACSVFVALAGAYWLFDRTILS